MKTLTKLQQHVVVRMREGWALCRGHHGGCWLQKNGAGMGGEFEAVLGTTVNGLGARGVIYTDGNFPTQTFRLAEEK